MPEFKEIGIETQYGYIHNIDHIVSNLWQYVSQMPDKEKIIFLPRTGEEVQITYDLLIDCVNEAILAQKEIIAEFRETVHTRLQNIQNYELESINSRQSIYILNGTTSSKITDINDFKSSTLYKKLSDIKIKNFKGDDFAQIISQDQQTQYLLQQPPRYEQIAKFCSDDCSLYDAILLESLFFDLSTAPHEKALVKDSYMIMQHIIAHTTNDKRHHPLQNLLNSLFLTFSDPISILKTSMQIIDLNQISENFIKNINPQLKNPQTINTTQTNAECNVLVTEDVYRVNIEHIENILNTKFTQCMDNKSFANIQNCLDTISHIEREITIFTTEVKESLQQKQETLKNRIINIAKKLSEHNDDIDEITDNLDYIKKLRENISIITPINTEHKDYLLENLGKIEANLYVAFAKNLHMFLNTGTHKTISISLGFANKNALEKYDAFCAAYPKGKQELDTQTTSNLIKATKSLMEVFVQSEKTFSWKRTWAKIKSFCGYIDADVVKYRKEESIKEQYEKLHFSDEKKFCTEEFKTSETNSM